MRQNSKSTISKSIPFSRFDTILLCTCACTLLQYKLFLLVLRIGRLLQAGTIIWLPSVFILDILVFGIVLAFLTAAKCGIVKTKAAAVVSKAFATSFALVVVLAACASLLLMIETGHELKWKIAFEVDWRSTKALFIPQIPIFMALVALQPILGCVSSCLFRWYLFRRNNEASSSPSYLPLYNSRSSKLSVTVSSIRYLNKWKWTILPIVYILFVITIRPHRPWQQLSNNPICGLAWTFFHPPPPRAHGNIPPPHWNQDFINVVAEQMSAPAADLSQPARAHLTSPIQNVVIINLESVRADALPFSQALVEAVGTNLVNESLTAEEITPFWNSLMPQSLVMNDTSATSSYTLKTLLSTFCGMYPLNVNFMEEGRGDRHFYQQCLPQLLREQFVDPNSQTTARRWWTRAPPDSQFRSAFFQTSDNTFDHQEEEFNKMGWDDVFYAPDVKRFTPGAKKMGWFGVGDEDLLPLFFDWVDNTLESKKQLLAGVLTTSTHYPFPLPDGEPSQEYVTNEIVNNYLNSIRMTDGLLRKIIGGFEERGVLNETMFVMLGDHGHGFDDWGHKILGALDNSMESGFRVPFMVYSPSLQPMEPVEGRYTNMDVLPTVMDVLISSSQDPRWYPSITDTSPDTTFIPSTTDQNIDNEHDTSNIAETPDTASWLSSRQTPNLLDLTQQAQQIHLQKLLTQYEGTSIFRPPLHISHPPRPTFHLDNPGNAHIILLQPPLKLVYDAIDEKTTLYSLPHDPGEWEDLLSTRPPPPWVEYRETDLRRELRFDWWVSREGFEEMDQGRTLPDREAVSEEDVEERKGEGEVGKVRLGEVFDWAEEGFQVLLGWSWINRERYLTGEKEVSIWRSRYSKILGE